MSEDCVVRPVISLKASDIARLVGGDLSGPDAEVMCVRPVLNLTEGALAFASGGGWTIDGDAKAVVLVRPGSSRADSNTYIEVDRPRLAFAMVLTHFFERRSIAGIAPSASISPEASIDPSVSIGERVVIEPGVIVSARALIGHAAIIHAGSRIGSDCVIGAGVVIGAAGFGYERDSEGIPHHLPHVGGTRLGTGVHVGANSTISRGTIADTEIGDHTKLGPLVTIQHNVVIGQSCIIASQAVVSGSVRIGDRVWLGPNCTIRQGRRIGSDATIGLGVLVLEDVLPHASIIGHAGTSVARDSTDTPKPAVATPMVLTGRNEPEPGTSLDRAIDDIFRAVFKLDGGLALHDRLVPDDVPGWDSLGNVNLLLQLQEQLNLRFDLEALAEIRSLGDLRRQLHRFAISKSTQKGNDNERP